MRNVLATLLLLLFLAGSGWAQTPSNGQTNIPNWLWVKPTVVDRTANAFCVWGGISLSLVNACDTPVIATDGSFTTQAIKLDYQTGSTEPSYLNSVGLWWVTPQSNTWDFIGASTDTSQHTLLIESYTDTGGTSDPWVIVRSTNVPGGGVAETAWQGGYTALSTRILHSADFHVFDNQATFVNIQVSTDSDLRGDVYDGAGTFTIADNTQVNGFLDLYNGGPIKSTTTDVTVDDNLILTGTVSDSNSDVTVADDFVVNTNGSGVGSVTTRDFGANQGVEFHVRPNSGKEGWVSFTEDSVADRWIIGIDNGDADLYFKSGSVSSPTNRFKLKTNGFEHALTSTSIPTYSEEIKIGGHGSLNFPAVGIHGAAGGVLEMTGDPDTSSYNGTIKFGSANRSTSDINTARFAQINGRSNGTASNSGGRLEFDFVPDAGSLGTYAHWSSAGLRLGDGTASSYLLQLNADSAGKPTSSTWTIVSDRKTKKNVTPINKSEAYNKFKALKVDTFQYNGSFGTIENAFAVGLIADEVAQQFPETVQTITLRDENGHPQKSPTNEELTVQTFNPHNVFMTSIAVIQELMARIEALEARVAALEKKP